MNAVFSKSNKAAEWGRKKILPRESYTTVQASGFASRHTTAPNKPSNHSAAWKVSNSIIQRSQNWRRRSIMRMWNCIHDVTYLLPLIDIGYNHKYTPPRNTPTPTEMFSSGNPIFLESRKKIS